SGGSDAWRRAREAEVSKLLTENDRLRNAIAEKDAAIAGERDVFATRMGQQEAELSELRAKAKQLDEFERVKRELDVLKSIEFPDLDESTSPADNDPAAAASSQQTIEKLLMAKNRRLQNELTTAKVALSETQIQLDSTRIQLEESNSRAEQQQRLVAKLEEDLHKLNN
ncbi:hypothetical protein HK102_011711, partial [Quaeritorhiza haematococci]